LAGELTRHSERLQLAIAPGFFDLMPDGRVIRAECADIVREAKDVQGAIERMDAWAHDYKFQVAVNLLRHGMDAHDAGLTLSDLADAVVEQAFNLVDGHFPAGQASPRGSLVVAAIGAWGSRDLTPDAPVELLFLHQEAVGAEPSLCRLARRLVGLCAAPSANGRLCDVDAATATWGAPGPLVTPIDAFVDHVRDRASAEQLIAVMQLRTIFGPTELRSQFETAMEDALTSHVAPEALFGHAHAKIGQLQAWDVTGTIDESTHCTRMRTTLDDTVRALQLRHAGARAGMLTPSVEKALAALSRYGLMDADTARRCMDARHRLRQIETMRIVRQGCRRPESSVPTEIDPDSLLAAGMVDMAEWRAFLAGALALLHEIRDQYFRDGSRPS
jgi:glutamine synthetase adenylyltransferase